MHAEFQVTHPDTFAPEPYICCLTAYSDKAYRDVALASGMNNYCLKPLALNHLKNILIRTRVIQ